jgi:hypothetical protein
VLDLLQLMLVMFFFVILTVHAGSWVNSAFSSSGSDFRIYFLGAACLASFLVLWPSPSALHLLQPLLHLPTCPVLPFRLSPEFDSCLVGVRADLPFLEAFVRQESRLKSKYPFVDFLEDPHVPDGDATIFDE